MGPKNNRKRVGNSSGPVGSGKKKKFCTKRGLKTLSKKQRSHLEQYGEIHPADEREVKSETYRVVTDTYKNQDAESEVSNENSSDDSEEESTTAYNQLIASIKESSNGQPASEESDISESDEDDEGSILNEQNATITESGDELVNFSDEEAARDDKNLEVDSDYREVNLEEDEGLSDKEDKVDVTASDDEETKEDEGDPFQKHYEVTVEESLIESLADKSAWESDEIRLPCIGSCTCKIPSSQKLPRYDTKQHDPRKLFVKNSLCSQLKATNEKLAGVSLQDDFLTPFQHSIFTVLNNYQDLYYPNRTPGNGEEIRMVYCLHAVNHILKTRSRVIVHNTKIKSRREDIPDNYRDQGLTRPKILIVLPFRDSALKLVNMIARLLMTEDQSYVNNRKRFQKEYGCLEDRRKGFKPADYRATFVGNIDDHFRIGISLAKKSLKLYTEFYTSDIIIASPLALRTLIGAEGESEREFDFLSSIEIAIFDQTDIFLMQNWDHILHIMKHMHLQPKASHGVDFSRVRMWALSGWSKSYCQSVIFSSVVTPEITSMFNKQCCNYAGKVIVPRDLDTGTICQIVTTLPQVFQRVDASSYSQVPDARFDFFVKTVLPDHKNPVMTHTMVFIPSYFDFVRIRNHLKKVEDTKFVQISEYSSDAKISRARTRFFHGRLQFILYTERSHFFRRFVVRGIKHLVFYELPTYPHFYSELCNMLEQPRRHIGEKNFTCTALYTKYDAQKLAAIVGTERASIMVGSEKKTHMFVTGDK